MDHEKTNNDFKINNSLALLNNDVNNFNNQRNDFPISQPPPPYEEALPVDGPDDGNYNGYSQDVIETNSITQNDDYFLQLLQDEEERQQTHFKCKRCKIIKSRGDFGIRRNSLRMRVCKRCTAERRIHNMVCNYFREIWYPKTSRR